MLTGVDASAGDALTSLPLLRDDMWTPASDVPTGEFSLGISNSVHGASRVHCLQWIPLYCTAHWSVCTLCVLYVVRMCDLKRLYTI